MNTYSLLRKLAKKSKFQNLFLICKELNGFKLFKNERELTQLQEIFLNYLYLYNSINQSIGIDKISKHVLDNELYEDCYLLWRNSNHKKEETNNKKSDINLVSSNTIIFPKEKSFEEN